MHTPAHLPRVHTRTLVNARIRLEPHATVRKRPHLRTNACKCTHKRKHTRASPRIFEQAYAHTRKNARTHKRTRANAGTYTRKHALALLQYLLNYQIAETRDEH